MSESREKKTRQDLSGSGWNDPKTAREAKQRQKEHSTNLLYGTIGVVFLVIAIAAVIWKSNIIPKTATAATVNGEKYTAAEVNFYFENYYQNFVNGNYSILSMIGLDTGTSLKDQTISSSAVMFVTDATEGETWYDYFADKALEQLAGVQAMNAAAEAEGFTWNDEMQADLDDTMESLASAASTYGYTEKQYLDIPAAIGKPEEFETWILDVSLRIHESINRERDNTTKKVILEARRYIENHYQDHSLSVEMICRELHMSPAYFSTMFRKVTGQTYIAYLTEVRLQKAVELLNETDDKTYVIAQKVGYQEQNYFSYVFKKRFGISPTKYRGTQNG